MENLNEWHDFFRVGVILIASYCFVVLLHRYRQLSMTWNEKTIDLWYSQFMWSLAAIVILAQGILLNRPFTPAVVVVTAAVLVTGRGLKRKGGWGSGS